MSKLIISFFITLAHSIPLYAQGLPSVIDSKPTCHMLSPAELAQKSKIKNYGNYHDYLYSRRTFKPSKSSIKEMLLADRFSYPEIDRWVKITKWMNKNNPTDTGEIFLPPCHVIETGEVTPEPPKVIIPVPPQELPPPEVKPVVQPEVKREIKPVVKKTKEPKKFSYSAGVLLGSVNIKSDDTLDSEFDLTFLKFIFSANYKLRNDLSAYAGIGLNNYLTVKFTSNIGKDEAKEVNQYWDYYVGMRKKISAHTISFQYDNMNFLLNQNKFTEFRLTPTRVDRISIMDSYKLNNKFSIMGSVGVFHPLFSQAYGYDLSFGPNLEIDRYWNLYLYPSFNQVTKDDIKNSSQAIVIGTNYKF